MNVKRFLTKYWDCIAYKTIYLVTKLKIFENFRRKMGTKKAGAEGLEPSTSGFGDLRSTN